MKDSRIIENQKIEIEKHFGLVHLCCQKFRNRGLEYDDIFQSGCIGLTKAAKKFDFSKGIKFSTYAVPVILGEIKSLFRENGSLKVSRSLKDLGIKINYEREKFLKLYEREPSLKELAEKLNVDKEQILEAIDVAKTPVSLDAPIQNNRDTNFVFEIPVPFDGEKIATKISLLQVLNTFKSKDKNLIYLRFFKGETQVNIAKMLGMTQVQVSRREKALIKIFREKLA